MRQPTDRSAKFWDRIADRYSRQPVADEAAYQKKLEITRGYFGPDMHVLEFGCGTGSTAIAHAPYVKHIHAIDLSAKMISIARDKAEAADVENVTFEQSTIEALNAPDQAFDAVLGLSILHLLDNKEAVVDEVYRVLKPGGVFVSNTACLGNTMLKYIKLIAPVGWLLGLMPRVKVFTTQQLKDCLTDAGFEIDYQWQADAGIATFIVAKKADSGG